MLAVSELMPLVHVPIRMNASNRVENQASRSAIQFLYLHSLLVVNRNLSGVIGNYGISKQQMKLLILNSLL